MADAITITGNIVSTGIVSSAAEGALITGSVATGGRGTDADTSMLVGYVNHGSVAGTARPTGYGVIYWHGSVEPTNAISGDVWVNTA